MWNSKSDKILKFSSLREVLHFKACRMINLTVGKFNLIQNLNSNKISISKVEYNLKWNNICLLDRYQSTPYEEWFQFHALEQPTPSPYHNREHPPPPGFYSTLKIADCPEKKKIEKVPIKLFVSSNCETTRENLDTICFQKCEKTPKFYPWKRSGEKKEKNVCVKERKKKTPAKKKKPYWLSREENFIFTGKKQCPRPTLNLWQKNDPYSRLNNKGLLVNTNIDQIYCKVTIYSFHSLVFWTFCKKIYALGLASMQ